VVHIREREKQRNKQNKLTNITMLCIDEPAAEGSKSGASSGSISTWNGHAGPEEAEKWLLKVQVRPGPEARDRCYDFKNIFAKKISELVFFKNLIITLVFEKNTNIFAENSQKSQKIVIITSTPVFKTVFRANIKVGA
jgi:hypothetical protein